MAYIAISDILNDVRVRTLIELTDDDDVKNLTYDETIINAAIAKADAIINSKLCSIYEVPVTTPDYILTYLKSIASNIVVYTLYKRAGVEIPDSITNGYTESQAELDQIQSGSFELAGSERLSGSSIPAAIATDKTVADIIYNDTLLNKY